MSDAPHLPPSKTSFLIIIWFWLGCTGGMLGLLAREAINDKGQHFFYVNAIIQIIMTMSLIGGLISTLVFSSTFVILKLVWRNMDLPHTVWFGLACGFVSSTFEFKVFEFKVSGLEAIDWIAVFIWPVPILLGGAALEKVRTKFLGPKTR